MENLRNLPPQSGYRAEKDQAKLDARVIGDTLYITAICDSLQLLVYQKDEEITRIRNELVQLKEEKKAAITLLDLIKCAVISFATGMGVAWFMRFIKRKKQEINIT